MVPKLEETNLLRLALADQRAQGIGEMLEIRHELVAVRDESKTWPG